MAKYYDDEAESGTRVAQKYFMFYHVTMDMGYIRQFSHTPQPRNQECLSECLQNTLTFIYLCHIGLI